MLQWAKTWGPPLAFYALGAIAPVVFLFLLSGK